jgi:hypothetical protein
VFGACLFPASASAALPLDPPQQFLVQGLGTLRVAGPHCCGATRLTGAFDARYQIASSGAVTLAALNLQLHDADVVVHDGFLGLFDQRIQLRCGVGATRPSAGTRVTATSLKFDVGAVTLDGLASEGRAPDGACLEPTLELAAANNAELLMTHDPVANRFGLSTTFHATLAGAGYDLSLDLSGSFANRPPQAVLGILTPQNPQGGCPAFWRWNGQLWERVAEANDPGGLKGTLHSSSHDPDGGWAHGDVTLETWHVTKNSDPRGRLGRGTSLGPLTFPWGPTYQVELLASDHAGATSAAACTFRVVDTRPPTVTAPAPLVTACTTAGGSTRASSPALAAFLSSASASDLGDAAPVALAPQMGGVDIAPTTLFPADNLTRTVSFRFRDRAGNEGQANSSVKVSDGVKPNVTLTLFPGGLPANLRWHRIDASLSASDNCGGPVTLRLVRISSNAPTLDAGDIVDANLGIDDRVFYLFARRAAPTLARVYTALYEGRDLAGNVRQVAAQVVVN